MTTPAVQASDPKLIATWKKVVALPIAAFFGFGFVVGVTAGDTIALIFLGLALIPVVYLLTVRRNALKRRQKTAPVGEQVTIGPNWPLIGIPVILALFVAGGALSDNGLHPDPNALVPDVVGASLSDAQDTLREAGLKTDTEDDTAQDRQVWNSSNWTVIRQSPTAGTPIGDTRTITLGVIKEGETTISQQEEERTASTPANEAAPTTTQTPAPTITEPATPQPPAENPAPLTADEQRMIEDAAHITNLKRGGVYFGGDEAAAIESGRITCRYIDNAANPSLAILTAVRTAQDAGYSRRDAEFIVGSAIGVYCDQYSPLITE